MTDFFAYIAPCPKAQEGVGYDYNAGLTAMKVFSISQFWLPEQHHPLLERRK